MGSLLPELSFLLFFLHSVVGVTTRSTMGPDVNNTDPLVKINNTEITKVTSGAPTTSGEIFGTTRFYETSTVTHTPLKSETYLAFENLALSRTAYKAETKLAKSFPSVGTLIMMDALNKTETTTLLESMNPTIPSVTIVSESGTAIGKTFNQPKTLTMASSTTKAEITTMGSPASAEAWPGLGIFNKVIWKPLIKPPLPSLLPHQNHGKHGHHPIGYHDYLHSVISNPWVSPLNSSIPENYQVSSSIKTPTFTETMTTTDTVTESELSNLFRTIVLEETSGTTKPPKAESVIVDKIIPFTRLPEITELALTASNTIEREGTPNKTTILPETLIIVNPITEATMLTSNLIDTFSTADSIQEIKTTNAVTLSVAYTKTEAETNTLKTGISTEILGVTGNNSQPITISEETTDDITKMIGTKAKTTTLPGTSMTINSSTEEGTSALLKTIFSSETSSSSSSAEEEWSAAVETLTMSNMITTAVSTTVESPNAVETLDTTSHTIETTAKIASDPLNAIYIATTEETAAVFTEVPSTVMIFMEERSTIAQFSTPVEFSDKVSTTTERTTVPGINSSRDQTLTSGKTSAIVSTIGKHTATAVMNQSTKAESSHNGGFLLLRLVVSSSLDLTDLKVAKEFLNKLHKDLQVQVPYTQISLMQVTKG